MQELESQIAKIQPGSSKSASNYVYVLAEKAQGSEAELFIVAELPLLNPAAESDCEKICLSIAGTLKRAFKRPLASVNFELAVNLVNEELAKLAYLGQTHWINRLNAILAVKIGKEFHIATTGKTSALLFRNGEFTDISCSADQVHPLKTFENFASGNIRVNDLIILSTTQLFNYLSIDRLKQILAYHNFLNAVQTIIELLKENAGPEVAFGTLLNLQLPEGRSRDEEIDLENFIVERRAGSLSFWKKILKFAAAVLPVSAKREPSVALPQVSVRGRLNNFTGRTKKLFSSGKQWLRATKTFGDGARQALSPKNFKQLAPEKKFFLIAILVLLATFISVVALAVHYKKAEKNSALALNRTNEAQKLADRAESELFYRQDSKAAASLAEAEAKLPKSSEVPKDSLEFFLKTSEQIKNLRQKLEKNTEAQITTIGNLGEGENLIKLPGMLATQSGQTIISYNKISGEIKDNFLKNKVLILNSVFLDKNRAAILSDNYLSIWDFSLGQNGSAFNSNIPTKDNRAGLAFYAANNRVYLIDRQNTQIINFLAGPDGFSKPLIAVNNPSLAKASDLALDGGIYALTESGIIKFQSGKPAEFNVPSLSKPLSGKGKIFTDKDTKNIYVLDAGNSRIVILDKKGNVLMTLASPQFSNLKDFQVDEKNKTIFVLNGSTLLKVTLP